MRKKSECLGVEKEATCKKRRYCKPTSSRDRRPHHCIYVGQGRDDAACYMPPRGATTFSLEFDYASFNEATYTNLLEGAGSEGLPVARNGRKTCVRRAPHHLARLQWAGLCEDGQPCPCRTADENRADASEELTPG